MQTRRMTPDDRPWLIAADWRSRALLRAELENREIEVRPEPGLRAAVRALLHEHPAPALILFDSAADPDADPRKLDRFLAVLAEDGVDPHLLLLVGAFERQAWEQHFGSWATIVQRPRSVGDIAKIAGRLLNALR